MRRIRLSVKLRAYWALTAILVLPLAPMAHGADSGGISGEEVYSYAETITDFGPRRPGSEAYKKAGDMISSRMEEWGYEVWTDSVSTRQHFPEHWLLAAAPEGGGAGLPVESYPMRFSASTAPGGLSAELADVGKGRESDFRGKDVAGKAVLVNWGHRIFNLISLGALRESYQRAQDHGAAGYILHFTNTPANSHQLMTAWVEEGDPAIPGFSIGKEDAELLREMLKGGGARVTMELSGEVREVEALNIFARLPGRSGDAILVDTHYCSMFGGAVDNASGVAVALGLARHMSELPAEDREKTLVFTFYGTHEYVDYREGAIRFLADNPDIADRAVAAIGLDHMAAYPDKEYFGRDFRLHPMTPLPGMDQMRGVFVSRNAALGRLVYPALIGQRLFPSITLPNRLMDSIKFGESEGDSLLDWCICESGPPFRMGVPTLRLMMAPQWYHTRLDTADHFSPEQLKRVSDFHLEVIEGLDPIPPEKLKDR